ncbi:MAG: FliG C-terminal domain-containing protein [Bdellovibrionota bacterium]
MSKKNLHFDSLSANERVAVLLLSLGKDTASEVLKHLSPTEVARIVKTLPLVSSAPAETHKVVNQEFKKILSSSEKLLVDGKAFAKDIMQRVLGIKDAIQADDSTEEIRSMLLSVPDNVLRDFLSAEHIQTSAFLLSVMDPEQSARILSSMDDSAQYDILIRVAHLRPIHKTLVSEVREIIREQLINENRNNGEEINGRQAAARIVNAMPRRDSTRILDEINQIEPEVKQEIEELIFTFEDLVKLPARSIQIILQESPRDKLVIALKTVDKDLRLKLLHNVSTRVRGFIEEELESMQPLRKVDVEAAQKDIIEIARRLDAEGRISLGAEESEVWV